MKKLRSYFYLQDYPAVRDMLILLVVFGGAFFLNLGHAGLIEPDEGRYSEIPREMLAKGDFVTPTLNYVDYFEKPPLHYWLNALSFKFFGLNEFAARFAGTMAGLLCVLLVYHTGRKLFGRREGLLSAFILGTSTGFLAQSRINLTDMTLTFFLSAAMCCFIIAANENEHYKKPYLYLFYSFMACAVLTKGLIGLVFPAGIIFIYLAATRQWHVLKKMRLPGGIALFLALAVPWFVLVSLRNPEFVNFFFIHEHFERFLTKVHGRYQPFWFFIPILLLTMLPWSFYAVRAIGRAWGNRRRQNRDQLLFLCAWAAIIFLFFSASSSKLIPYILPVFPPLAILIGKMFSDLFDQEQRTIFGLETTVLAALLILMAVLAIIYPYVQTLAPILTVSGLVRPGCSFLEKQPIITSAGGVAVACILLTMAAVIWMANRKKDVLILFAGLCLCSFLLETIGFQIFMEGVAYKKSSKELAILARNVLSDGSKLVSFGYEQSLPFYTGRRVVVVGGMGELEFGSRQGDQTGWFLDEAGFIRLWREERQVIALLNTGDYERISRQLVPAPTNLGRKGKKVLICKENSAPVQALLSKR